jgi:hypothetical protein
MLPWVISAWSCGFTREGCCGSVVRRTQAAAVYSCGSTIVEVVAKLEDKYRGGQHENIHGLGVSIIKLYKQNMHKHYNNLYKIVKMRGGPWPNMAPIKLH